MLDYLIDTNLQVVEIRDKVENKTIAQTQLFVAKDNQGNLNLILDNVEVNTDYAGLESEIRKNLFDYLKEYTQTFSRGKIKRILLGASSYNDIETKGLNSISLSQTKLAGSPRETEYLDAFGSAWVDPSKETLKSFFVAADLEKEKLVEKRKIFLKAESFQKLTPEILRAISQIEEVVFPEQMQSDENDLRETLENKKGIQIILKNKETNEIVGYLSSKPQKDVVEELKNWDKDLKPEEGVLYLESIAIKPEFRGLESFLKIKKLLLEEMKKKGCKKVALHARAQSGLSHVLQKRYEKDMG